MSFAFPFGVRNEEFARTNFVYESFDGREAFYLKLITIIDDRSVYNIAVPVFFSSRSFMGTDARRIITRFDRTVDG